MQKRKSQRTTSHSGTSPSDHPKAIKHQEPLLVRWDDLPSFLRDNEYIHSGYQPQSNSYRKCIQGLRYLHNQTGNIYTQAFGVSILVSIGIFLHRSIDTRLPAASNEDVIVFGAFFFGLITSLTLSSIFHTITNHSQKHNVSG